MRVSGNSTQSVLQERTQSSGTGNRSYCAGLLEDSAACMEHFKETPKKLTGEKSTEMSFFALPSKQGSLQGRFKLAHRPISLSAKAPACVRRFETPTPLNHGRTESKKDIPMLGLRLISKS